MNKMLINHLDKIFVTSDTATLLKELEVAHPAAKIMVMAAQMQESEIGDGSNFVIVLIGELLAQAGQWGTETHSKSHFPFLSATFICSLFFFFPFSSCPQLPALSCRSVATSTLLS